MVNVDESDKYYTGCEKCIHADDELEVCVARFCIHAIGHLKECYKPKNPAGHWIKDTYRAGHCSECGHIQSTNGFDMTDNCNILNALYKYCPNCGAEMGVEQK